MSVRWLALCALLIGTPAYGQGAPSKPSKKVVKKPGTVLTFYGLRKLEQDPDVSDESKLEEWQAFIERADDQIAYAKRAIDRWKNAARLRVVDGATRMDADSEATPREKINKWRDVQKLYPRSNDARRAKKRIAYWTSMETKRLASNADDIERAGRPKVERIAAWVKVLEWVDKGPEARAALRRINDLQRQLYTEALSVDKIARIPTQTKLEAWHDVLNGRPTPDQAKKARARVQQLEGELVQDDGAMKKAAKKDSQGGM